jgi:hypothetical protein
MSLSLSKKALILVAIPLAFEIVFVVSLSALLYSVDNERKRENPPVRLVLVSMPL